jgi:hypothetical protein
MLYVREGTAGQAYIRNTKKSTLSSTQVQFFYSILGPYLQKKIIRAETVFLKNAYHVNNMA